VAAVFQWGEDNGAAAGNPAKGTTRTYPVTQVNWKNTDDVNTAYSSSPISAGNNSYEKFQFGIFSGTFTQISNAKWQHVSGTLGAGLTLKGLVSSGYTTPATTTNAALLHNITLTGDIATGLAVLFGTVGPQQAGAATLAATGYTQYLITQMQTTVAAAAGDTAVCTLALRYDET
jgi:hypothetical protein